MILEAREDTFNDDRWDDVQEWFSSECRDKEADVVFLGDDHIAFLEQTSIYRESIAPMHCLCFGAIGDRIPNLLWRLGTNILYDLSPKVIIVSIGNSDYGLSKDEVLDGIKCVAETIKSQKQNCKLFFMKLLPSGRRPNKRRKLVNDVNESLERTLAGFADVIDVEPSIQDANGNIDAHHMFDYVHLTQEGYRKIFEPVSVAISAALNPNV